MSIPEGYVDVSGDGGVLKCLRREGSGETPGDQVLSSTDKVVCSVHYVGTFYDTGDKFDSSRDRGSPFKFDWNRGRVIRGWDVGVGAMRPGELADFILAPEYAYGSRGAQPTIGPNKTLCFEVEMIGFNVVKSQQ